MCPMHHAQTDRHLYKTRLEKILQHWLLAGYIGLLTGLFWLSNGSLYTKVYYGLIAAPAAISLFVARGHIRLMIREPVVLAFLAFSTWLLITLSWSSTDESVGSMAKRPLYVFMLFVACSFVACRDEQVFMKVLRVAAAIGAAAALGNLILFAIQMPGDGRLIGSGALRNPLLTSHVLGFFCTYWIATWLARNERQEWLPILLSCILLAALLATGSRTPLLGLAVVSAWMLLICTRRALYLVGTLGTAAAISAFCLPQLLLQRGVSFRPQLWADAWRQSLEQFWLGHGYDSRFVFQIAEIGYPLSDPHNIELAVLLEMGLVGLVIWLALYALTLLRCLELRHDRHFQIASALVVYGFAAGLTEGSSFLSRPNESWFLLWIPFALVAALSISRRKQAEQ